MTMSSSNNARLSGLIDLSVVLNICVPFHVQALTDINSKGSFL